MFAPYLCCQRLADLVFFVDPQNPSNSKKSSIQNMWTFNNDEVMSSKQPMDHTALPGDTTCCHLEQSGKVNPFTESSKTRRPNHNNTTTALSVRHIVCIRLFGQYLDECTLKEHAQIDHFILIDVLTVFFVHFVAETQIPNEGSTISTKYSIQNVRTLTINEILLSETEQPIYRNRLPPNEDMNRYKATTKKMCSCFKVKRLFIMFL